MHVPSLQALRVSLIKSGLMLATVNTYTLIKTLNEWEMVIDIRYPNFLRRPHCMVT